MNQIRLESMGGVVTFDTHRFVKRLTDNGFSNQQAEVLADEQVNLLNSNLATKTDILITHAEIEKVRAEVEKFRVEVTAEMDKIRLEVKTNIEKFRAEVTAEIDKVKSEVTAEIDKIRLQVKADIEKSHSTLVKWVVGGVTTLGGVTIAVGGLITSVIVLLP